MLIRTQMKHSCKLMSRLLLTLEISENYLGLFLLEALGIQPLQVCYASEFEVHNREEK